MDEFTFTPTAPDAAAIKVPFFEDARADFAPYYSAYRTGKENTLQRAQNEVITELAKLGAGGVLFQQGRFGSTPARHGYIIRFQYGGSHGLIRVAGLPIRSETDKRIQGVLSQALLNVRDWLKAAVTAQVFSPGSDALIPFMIVAAHDGHEYTLADYVRSIGKLPALTAEATVTNDILFDE